jgi:hypothetical protein
MAASSSNALPTITGGHVVVSEKLTRDNYMLWKAQVLPTVRGAQLMGYLDGTLGACLIWAKNSQPGSLGASSRV